MTEECADAGRSRIGGAVIEADGVSAMNLLVSAPCAVCRPLHVRPMRTDVPLFLEIRFHSIPRSVFMADPDAPAFVCESCSMHWVWSASSGWAARRSLPQTLLGMLRRIAPRTALRLTNFSEFRMPI